MKMKFKNKDKVLIFILLLLLIISKLTFYVKKDTAEINIGDKNSEIILETKKKIVVHIEGAVKEPGVYNLIEGKRVSDLVKKAGGLTEKTDEKRINLARILSDEDKIYIPFKSEYIDESNKNNDILTLTDFNQMTAEELMKIDGIGEVIAKRIIEYKKNNGNFNSVEELLNIDGIGEKKLEKIKAKIF